jgi:ketosteroid isomerase-like protein
MALMADDVVLMPPNEAVLKGKAAVRAWYDRFLT